MPLHFSCCETLVSKKLLKSFIALCAWTTVKCPFANMEGVFPFGTSPKHQHVVSNLNKFYNPVVACCPGPRLKTDGILS